MSGFYRIHCGRRAAVFFVLVPVLSFSFVARSLGAETYDGDAPAHTAEAVFPPIRTILFTPFAVTVAAAVLFAAISSILLFLCIHLCRTVRKQRAVLLSMPENREKAYRSALSYVSHEIRTPLSAVTSIVGKAEIEDDLPDAAKEKMRQIRAFTQYALRIVDNVLDIKRLEIGRQILDPAPFSVRTLLKETEEIIRAEASSHKISIIFRKKLIHDVFVGDAVRLEQVLLNLLTNAVKYTPQNGRVCLFVREFAAGPVYSEIRFRVTDNGIGISKEDHQRIFEAFEQVEPVRGNKHGIGLGLAICKELVENMGGKLCIESEPGKGSEFYFTIRLEKSAADVSVRDRLAGLKDVFAGLHVLLAEDNALLADFTAQLLKYMGASVLYAASGTDAVTRFAKSVPGQIDVVLMDVRMPDMNGFAAAAEIRALGRTDSDVPVIAMSADAFAEENALAEAVGIDVFLLKPVSAERLYDAMQEAISRDEENVPRQAFDLSDADLSVDDEWKKAN